MPDGKLKLKATVSAVVTRADGTVEDLGIVASSEKDSGWLAKIAKRLSQMRKPDGHRSDRHS